jgi:ribonucleoside-diphosphate reductase alpha chain
MVDLEVEAVDRILKKIYPSYIPDDFIGHEDNVEHMVDEFKLWWNVRNKALNGRKTGCGILGYGDMLAALGLEYGNPEVTEKVFRTKLKAELDATTDLSILRGHFPLWDHDKEYEIKKIEDNVLDLVGKNEWYKFIGEEFPVECHRVIKHGRRNVSQSTVAPTGSVGILCGTTSGIEPLFMFGYTRRKRAQEGEVADVVTENGSFKEYAVVHPKLNDFYDAIYKVGNRPQNLDEWEKIYLSSPYANNIANDIPYDRRVETQGLIQKYIYSSISSTVNLPESVSVETVDNIYREAYKKGLKGITVYRANSRGGVLVEKPKPKDECEEFVETHALKRGKELDADFYKVKYKGENWIVLIGLRCNKPYEIFVFKPNLENTELQLPYKKITDHKGKIVKIKKGSYKFISEFIEIPDLQAYNSEEEKRFCYRTSMELRHGIPLEFLVSTIKKYDDNITSFSSLTGRILSKYMPISESKGDVCPECGGKLLNEGGCVHCVDCGYQKCG